MSGWGTNGNANRIKDTYIKGFLDVSGGPLIVEKSSSLQVMAHDSDNPVIEFKSEYFTVNTTSAVDISYSALAAIGFLGVSFENSTTDITNRVKYITTGETGVDPNKVFYTKIGNDDEKSDLQVYGFIKGHYGLEVDGDVSLNNNLFVAGDSSMNNNLSLGGNLYVAKQSVFSLDVSMNGNLSVNNDLSLNGNLYVAKRSLFTLDASFNGNTKLGSGSSSVSVNKDISSAFALDVSGSTVLRNTLYVGSDVSLNTNLYVNNDLSLNGNLYVVKRSLFTLDVSMSKNLDIGSGSSSVAINKDISSAFALDVSGSTVLRNTLYVGSDVSLNTNLYVNNDLSLNGNLYVVKRSLFTLDASFNGNTKLGSGSSSVSVNKDISSAFALDVSGSTVLRNTLYVGSDVSLNTNLYVNNDLSLNGNLYVGKRSLFTLDVSMNGNLDIGSGSNSVSINKDISAGIALDVSGSTVLRNTLYVGSDVSLNTNLYVNNDLSLNGNLYVGKRSLFTLDASFNGNTKLGSGSSSVSVNKDISSAFALDVSGATILRNTLSVSSNVTFDGSLSVANITEPNPAGDCNLWTNSTGGNINIGTQSATGLYLKGTTIDIQGASGLPMTINTTGNFAITNSSGATAGFITGSKTVGVNIGTGNFTTATGIMNVFTGDNNDASSKLNIGTGTTNAGEINIATGGSRPLTSNTNIGGTVNLGSATSKTSVLGIMNVTNDASLNGNVKLGSGSRSVSINKDISAGIALDVSGATILRNTLFVATDVSVNGDLKANSITTYSSITSTAGNMSAYNMNASNVMTANSIQASTTGIQMDIATNQIGGVLNIGTETTRAGDINIGTGTTAKNIYIGTKGGSGTTTLQMSGSAISIGQSNTSTLNLNPNTTGSGSLNLGNGMSSGTVNMGTGMTGGTINIGNNGSTTSSTTLNIATGTNVNGPINIGNSASAKTINIGGTSTTLVLAGSSISTANDVSLNGNTKLGSGNRSVAINKDISSAFALDVSGSTVLRNTLYVGSDVSLNTNLYVNNDLSLNGNLYVGKRSLFTLDVSMNGNLDIGSGSNSVAINKDISSAFALDVSGSTVLRNTLYVGSDVSLNTNLYVNNDLSLNGNLYVGKRSLFTLDVSMSQNLDIGSGSSSVAINKDISSAFALDVSGSTVLRNTLYVGSDVSLNTNLYVNNDLSLNGNLYVVKRSVFTMDVSMLGNLDIGSGSSSFAINKDISSNFALDVSGVSQFRGNVDVAGTFTVNGAPVSGGGGSLTGNVQVGSNSGFVSINKPQFYSDPSLTIYYDFDVASYTGTTIANKGNGGAGFTATLQGTTTGMIDSTNFKYGTASLKNDTLTLLNQGIKVNSTAVPIGRTMTISFWLRKKTTPPATTFDRIFEFSTNPSVGAVGENNSIALDISSSGIILPVLTNGTASCFGTLSTPIISYNVCDDVWKHIVWSINGSSSVIYVNGSNTQRDTIVGTNPFDISSVRTSLTIGHSTVTSLGSRDFSGNIDDFRYYKDDALNYAEIYQLYNNNFYTLDICGGFLANGPSVIYEASGSVATANRGTLTLLHGDASGSSSIMFKSVNSANDYAYVQYQDNNTVPYIKSFYKWNLSPGAANTYGLSTTVDKSVGSNTTVGIGTSLHTIVYSVLAPSPSTFPSNTYCISFNQTNQTDLPGTGNIDYIQASVEAIQQNITISFWIRPNITWDTYNIGGNSYRYFLANFSNAGTNVIDIYIRGSDKRLYVLINGNGTNFKTSNTSIDNNTWTHVAFTYSASPNDGYIYINGVRDEITNGTGYTAFGTLPTYGSLLIGARWAGTAGANYQKGFRGYMNFINIFNQTLSDRNISYLYNNPSYVQTTALMTIGIEDDAGSDRISLFASGGTGFVGVNTKTPLYSLDVSGQMRIYEGAGTTASATNGSLTLEHAVGGTSSLVFKASNSSSTNDYAYVQYEDATPIARSQLKYDFSFNSPATLTGDVSNASTGSTTTTMLFRPTTNTFAWHPTPGQIGLGFGAVTPAFCISFNQTNLSTTDTTTNINYLQSGYLAGYKSFSFSAWIRPGTITPAAGSGTTVRWMIANLHNDNANGVVDIWLESNGYIYALLNDDDGNFIRSTTTLAVGTWYHILFTYDEYKENGYLYINGNLDTFVEGNGLAGKALKDNQGLFLGMKYGWNTGTGTNIKYPTATSYIKGFRGQMAFVNVFNVPLTVFDVLYLYNNPTYSRTISDRGLMTIGIESETGYIHDDCISLFPGGGQGFVGINNKDPQYSLDVTGSIYASNTVFAGATTSYSDMSSNPIAGGLIVRSIGTSGRMILGAYYTPGSFGCAIQSSDFYNGVDHAGPLFLNQIGGGVGIGRTNISSGYILDVNGNVQAWSYNATSDYRIKTNVVPLDSTFNVDLLKPVYYNLKHDDGRLNIGFIAHEVQEVYPFLVSGEKDGKDTQSLNYNGFIGILTKEIQVLKKKEANALAKAAEQEARIAEQERKSAEQEARISDQEQRIQALEKMMLDLINK